MGRDISDFWYEGRRLRDESARLLLWANQNGKRDGEHFLAQRERLRTAAQQWKRDVEAGMKNPARLLRDIFEPKSDCQFNQATVNAARAELGI
jgi:hypothetical protein